MIARWKIGIVGFGKMGQYHAEVWSRIPGVRIIAVVEPVQTLREEARTEYECFVSAGLEETLTDAPPDILIVATHVPLHHPQTLAGIRTGCHVVCEKPMALSLRECDQMVSEAKEAGVALAVHHQSIFSRAFEAARREIATGAIGKLQFLRAYGKGRIAASDLMEIAGHLVHGMRYLAGAEVTEVYGDVTYQGRDVTVADATRVQDLYPEGRDSGIGAGDRILGYYKFSNGARAELQLTPFSGAPKTFQEQRNFGYYIDIFGSTERLQLYVPRVLFRNRSPLDDLARNATPWEEVDPDFRNERDSILTRAFAEDFLRAIEAGQAPLVSGAEGRMAMEMTLGIYTSHLAGVPLSIPLENREHPFEEP